MAVRAIDRAVEHATGPAVHATGLAVRATGLAVRATASATRAAGPAHGVSRRRTRRIDVRS